MVRDLKLRKLLCITVYHIIIREITIIFYILVYYVLAKSTDFHMTPRVPHYHNTLLGILGIVECFNISLNLDWLVLRWLSEEKQPTMSPYDVRTN